MHSTLSSLSSSFALISHTRPRHSTSNAHKTQHTQTHKNNNLLASIPSTTFNEFWIISLHLSLTVLFVRAAGGNDTTFLSTDDASDESDLVLRAGEVLRLVFSLCGVLLLSPLPS